MATAGRVSGLGRRVALGTLVTKPVPSHIRPYANSSLTIYRHEHMHVGGLQPSLRGAQKPLASRLFLMNAFYFWARPSAGVQGENVRSSSKVNFSVTPPQFSCVYTFII